MVAPRRELFGTSATRVSRSLALLRDRTRRPRFSINGSITQIVSLLLVARSRRSIRINRLLYRGGKRRKESAITILAKSYPTIATFLATHLIIVSRIIPVQRRVTQRNKNSEIVDGKVFARKFSARLCRGRHSSTPRHGKRKKYDRRREGREKEGDNTPMHTRYIRFRATSTEYLHLPIIRNSLGWLKRVSTPGRRS